MKVSKNVQICIDCKKDKTLKKVSTTDQNSTPYWPCIECREMQC